MTYSLPMRVGDRVAIAPHHDLWMAGCRFGTVTSINEAGRFYFIDLDTGRNVTLDHDDLLGTVRRAEQVPTYDQILPGQSLDGGIVIASIILNDTDYEDVMVMALLLMPTPGSHYRRVDVWQTTREIFGSETYPNIVPAVEAYVDNGGDY